MAMAIVRRSGLRRRPDATPAKRDAEVWPRRRAPVAAEDGLRLTTMPTGSAVAPLQGSLHTTMPVLFALFTANSETTTRAGHVIRAESAKSASRWRRLQPGH